MRIKWHLKYHFIKAYNMKLFLDTIDINEIKTYHDYGILDGVTTNPSLMSKATQDVNEQVKAICNLIDGDVSIEVISSKYQDMINEGKKFVEIANNVVIKLPMTWDGVRACRYFADNDIKVNMTLCFSVNQAMLAAKSGATYISPFIGRLDDIGEDGMELIHKIRLMYDNYGFQTEILAASIRSPDHVEDAVLAGADVATIPPKIMQNLVMHHLTDAGIKKFNKDWQTRKEK